MTAQTANSNRLPAPGVWTVDPGHADIGFWGRHFGLTKVRGRFTDVQATVMLAEPPSESTVDVTIEVASVDTGDATRDAHLRSAEMFDVERHPTATFRSTRLLLDGTAGTMAGDLTMKGVTRPVTLDVTHLGHVVDPWGGERAVVSAAGVINREDWGLTWNMVLEAGGLLVSKEIHLELEVELVRQAA